MQVDYGLGRDDGFDRVCGRGGSRTAPTGYLHPGFPTSFRQARGERGRPFCPPGWVNFVFLNNWVVPSIIDLKYGQTFPKGQVFYDYAS